MSASPQEKGDVDPAPQSGDEQETHKDQMEGGDMNQLLGDFEVKEQDRWLPIANAMSKSPMSRGTSPRAVPTPVPTPLAVPSPPAKPSQVAADGKSEEPTEAVAGRLYLGTDAKTRLYIESDANIRNFAPVARIMKTALPDNAKIAKEAKECMQECVSEFISFITSEASEKCQQEKRKTVNGEDILFAMTSLGFENYAEALKIYLSKYRETQSARGENQQQQTARPTSSGGSTTGYIGGPVGGANPGAATASANAPNNILSPHGMDESDAGHAYGYSGMVATGNGAGGEGY